MRCRPVLARVRHRARGRAIGRCDRGARSDRRQRRAAGAGPVEGVEGRPRAVGARRAVAAAEEDAVADGRSGRAHRRIAPTARHAECGVRARRRFLRAPRARAFAGRRAQQPGSAQARRRGARRAVRALDRAQAEIHRPLGQGREVAATVRRDGAVHERDRKARTAQFARGCARRARDRRIRRRRTRAGPARARDRRPARRAQAVQEVHAGGPRMFRHDARSHRRRPRPDGAARECVGERRSRRLACAPVSGPDASVHGRGDVGRGAA